MKNDIYIGLIFTRLLHTASFHRLDICIVLRAHLRCLKKN